MSPPLDETISDGQLGHLTDHEVIAQAINDMITAADELPITPPAGYASTDTEALIAEIAEAIEQPLTPGQPNPVDLQKLTTASLWTTATPLGGAGTVTFPTSSRLDVSRWASVRGGVFADAAGTLHLDWYPSLAGALIRTESVAISAASGSPLSGQKVIRKALLPYLVIRYVNGATPQTTFEAWLRGSPIRAEETA